MHQPTKTQVSKEGDDDPLSALTAASTDALDGDGDSSSSSANNGGGRRTHHGRGGSKGSGGAWRRYYEGLELIEEIRRDLTRLYPRWVLNRGVWGGGVFGLLVRTHTYPTKFPSPYAARSYSTPSPTPIHPTYPDPLINHHHTHIYTPPKKAASPRSTSCSRASRRFCSPSSSSGRRSTRRLRTDRWVGCLCVVGLSGVVGWF